jgi:hypothetical protein
MTTGGPGLALHIAFAGFEALRRVVGRFLAKDSRKRLSVFHQVLAVGAAPGIYRRVLPLADVG